MIYINFSLDIEGVHGNEPFEQMVLGKCLNNYQEFGALFLASKFNEYKIISTFFVDTHSRVLHGNDKLVNLISNLKKYNQDIQLHTHPSWRVDKRDNVYVNSLKNKSFKNRHKDLMFKLNREEQESFIFKEKEFLENMCDVTVSAHRSGGYAINHNTFHALKFNSIFCDSSCYYGHYNTKKYLPLGFHNDIFEVPISFTRVNKQFKRFDIDYCSFGQIKSMLDSLKYKNEDFYFTIFGHSYSLIDFDNTFSFFVPNKLKISNFVNLLKYISDNKSLITTDIISNFPRYYDQSNTNNFIPDMPPIPIITKLLLSSRIPPRFRTFLNMF